MNCNVYLSLQQLAVVQKYFTIIETRLGHSTQLAFENVTTIAMQQKCHSVNMN